MFCLCILFFLFRLNCLFFIPDQFIPGTLKPSPGVILAEAIPNWIRLKGSGSFTFPKYSVNTLYYNNVSVSSVTQSCLTPCDPMNCSTPRPPWPSPTPGVQPNPCPLSHWYHPTISSSVVPFSSCPQSFPASGSFQTSQLFASGGQSIGVSASVSVLPMNIQDWSPLGWTGWISLQSKGLSRVFSNTTVQKHQFFSTQLSL